MKILVLSDTHGEIPQTIRDLSTSCDYVIHAGDIGSLNVLRKLRFYNENTCFVRGNCDRGSWAEELPETILFHLDGILFYVIHNATDIHFRPEDAQIIISGHTHRYANGHLRSAVTLNPGSCSQPRGGEPASCAIVTTENGAFEIQKILV